MTKHDLIAQVGGIERAREILSGAPFNGFAYDTEYQEYICDGDIQDGYSIDHYDNCIVIGDLRTAIELSGNTGQLEVLEMIHVSPSCKVIER